MIFLFLFKYDTQTNYEFLVLDKKLKKKNPNNFMVFLAVKSLSSKYFVGKNLISVISITINTLKT